MISIVPNSTRDINFGNKLPVIVYNTPLFLKTYFFYTKAPLHQTREWETMLPDPQEHNPRLTIHLAVQHLEVGIPLQY